MTSRMIAAGVAIVGLLAACSPAGPGASTPIASTPALGATAAAIVTLTPVAATAQPAPTSGGVVGGELASRFPTQIDGNPVTDLRVKRLIDFQREFGLPEEEIAVWTSALASIGIDHQTVEVGNATATAAGEELTLSAMRVPGHDASTLIPLRELFSAVNSDDVLSTETVGGKNVTVVRSSGGYAGIWMYANGDTLWTIDTTEGEEAEAVFAALP